MDDRNPLRTECPVTQTVNCGVLEERPVPVTVIVSFSSAVLSPKEPVAVPLTPVVTVRLGLLLALEVPFAAAKYPVPELVNINDTPLV